jgi:uncharacterized surface protein with fasciclin (FAS1) repeats
MQYKQLLGAALAVVAARAQEANSTGSANLTSVLAGNENLTSLVSLLSASPDLANSLGSAQNITLFAPSNDALSALNSSGLLSSSSQEGLVQALLSYHVLVGVFNSSSISETPVFPATLLNNTAFANVTGGQVVECRVVDDEVLVISGLKNNVSVTQAVSLYLLGRCEHELTATRTSHSTTASSTLSMACSPSLRTSASLLKKPV